MKINPFKLKEHGTVAEIRQDVVHVVGLNNCLNGQLVRIGDSVEAVILGFDKDYVLVLLMDTASGIKPGDRVVTILSEFKIPVGQEFLGRRVNALCKPIDSAGPIREDTRYPIFGVAPSV